MASPILSATACNATSAAWSRAAIVIVGLCFAINMVDGMDVVIMSYIAPAQGETGA